MHWSNGFGDTNRGFITKAIEFAANSSKSSTGELHKIGGKKEWKNLNSNTNNDTEWSGGRCNEDHTGELSDTKEHTEHRIEEEHLGKIIFPFLKMFFGIRKNVEDEGDWRNGYKKNN